MLGSLSVKEENIVREFRRCIEHRFPEQSPQVVLYGSYARGDSHVDSDIDLLVVIRDDDWRVADRIREAGYDMDDSIDYRLSIVVVSRDHYERLKLGGYQFVRNVEADGVAV